MSILRFIVRRKFQLTSRGGADRAIRKEASRSVALARELGPQLAVRSVKVPKMPGVDEDMREWSVIETLEHNRIVNGMMMRVFDHLANDAPVPPKVDTKRDVMPVGELGFDAVLDGFEQSVSAFLAATNKPERTRGTERRRHPLFGPFDAHMWHCMMGFHLMVHRRQMAAGAKLLRSKA